MRKGLARRSLPNCWRVCCCSSSLGRGYWQHCCLGGWRCCWRCWSCCRYIGWWRWSWWRGFRWGGCTRCPSCCRCYSCCRPGRWKHPGLTSGRYVIPGAACNTRIEAIVAGAWALRAPARVAAATLETPVHQLPTRLLHLHHHQWRKLRGCLGPTAELAVKRATQRLLHPEEHGGLDGLRSSRPHTQHFLRRVFFAEVRRATKLLQDPVADLLLRRDAHIVAGPLAA